MSDGMGLNVMGPGLSEGLRTLMAQNEQAQIEHLTKVVRVLWHEVERLRTAITVNHNDVTIKVDGASFVMKRDGSIALKGNHIAIDGSGHIQVKASGPLVLKGSSIQQN